MARTYGMIGSRADLGARLAEVQLRRLESASVGVSSTWGVGFFEKDEVLLRRGPSVQPPRGLCSQVRALNTHGLLAHECSLNHNSPSPDAIPPLRYGHLLFSCHGARFAADSIATPARQLQPEYLHRTMQGETFSEVAFALFLAELPAASLARTRQREPKRSADPLNLLHLKTALKRTLTKLDALSDSSGRPRFEGDLWLHTGEILLIVHRRGNLALQVLRGEMDWAQWELDDLPRVGLEQSHFVTAVAQDAPLGPNWERLPESILFTAQRGRIPESEAL